MHTLSHIVRIITIVALFLDARTHHVDKSVLPDENTLNRYHGSHDVIKTALHDQSNEFNIFDYVVTRPNLFGVTLLCLAIAFGCYIYCLARWVLDDSTIVEILQEFLFFLCYPLIQVLLLFPFLWRRIMEVIRPSANDENFNAVRFNARNNDDPNVQEIELVRTN